MPPVKIGRPLPRSHESSLLRALAPMVADIRASLKSLTTPDDAKRLGVALKTRWSDERLVKIVGGIGTKVEAAGSLPWRPLTRKRKSDRTDTADIDGIKLVEGWTKDAFALIKSVRGEVAEGLRKDIVSALEKGTPIKEIRLKWMTQGIPVEFGTAEGRIKTIARHQVTLLNSKVQAFRAGQVGVTEFIWHKNTERHAHLDGRSFTYSSGAPEAGLPGEPVNCQCWAESIVPDELARELGLGSVFG